MNYDRNSYLHQFCEIDAELYSWKKTVEVLSEKFSKDDIKQSLVRGLKSNFAQPWFASKFFDTYDDALANLQDSFAKAKNMTYDIDKPDIANKFSKGFMRNKFYYNQYLHSFGSKRNDVLFEYCVKKNAVDLDKFPCLENSVKQIKSSRKSFRRLPHIDYSDENEKDIDYFL